MAGSRKHRVRAQPKPTHDSKLFCHNVDESFDPHESIGNTIEEAIDNLQPAGNQGISAAPSFRNNEFPSPNSTQLPHFKVHESGDSPFTDDESRARQNSRSRSDSALKVRSPITASESGRSDLSFLSITIVDDRGTQACMDWESDLCQRIASDSLEASESTSASSDGRRLNFDETKTTLEPSFQSLAGSKNQVRLPDMIEPINIRTVCNEICASLETSAFDEKEYLPLDRLRQILSRNVVRELLNQSFDQTKAAELEEAVLGTIDPDLATTPSPARRRRILAILIQIESLDKLPEIVDERIDDTSLPLMLSYKNRENKVYYATRDGSIKGCFASWDSKLAHDFSMNQRVIHAPFFKFPGDEISFYNLEHDSRVPFCSYESHAVGGYGTVHKAGIHQAHHNYGDNNSKQPRTFAVKQLHGQNDEDYMREVRAFEKLGIEQKDGSPNHLISLQLTFKHGRNFYLLFPWADGNLKEFWERNKLDPADPDAIKWFFGQVWGITYGLRKIHHTTTRDDKTSAPNDALVRLYAKVVGDEQWGRHGDIKPENILWFKDYCGRPNHLVISDFGLTQFNTSQSKSRVLQHQIQGFSGTYRPPDLHLDESISQRYDMWSLGCVILEFVSWLLLGYEQGVVEFINARVNDETEPSDAKEDKFFSLIGPTEGAIDKKRAKVKPSVIEWIKKLHKTSGCSKPLHSLLDLTQYAMLAPCSQKRWKCDRVNNELKKLCEIVNELQNDYKPTKGAPNSNKFPQETIRVSADQREVDGLNSGSDQLSPDAASWRLGSSQQRRSQFGGDANLSPPRTNVRTRTGKHDSSARHFGNASTSVKNQEIGNEQNTIPTALTARDLIRQAVNSSGAQFNQVHEPRESPGDSPAQLAPLNSTQSGLSAANKSHEKKKKNQNATSRSMNASRSSEPASELDSQAVQEASQAKGFKTRR